MMIGGVWEICEFAYDGILVGQNTQRWQGFIGREALYDSMFDLISDFLGSLISAVIVFIDRRKLEKSMNKTDNA